MSSPSGMEGMEAPLLSQTDVDPGVGPGSEHELTEAVVGFQAKPPVSDVDEPAPHGRPMRRHHTMVGEGHLDARTLLKKKEKDELIHDFFSHHDQYPDITLVGRKFVEDLESLEYEESESIVHQMEMHKKTIKWSLRIEALKWIACFFIGLFTGLVAFGIDFCVRFIAVAKFDLANQVFEASGHTLFPSILVYVGICTALVAVAGALVSWVEHLAAGSGIPEIKCYLNGVRMPRILRLRTLISKAVGVLFSVAGGLAVGKEGPMIHSGAIVAAGVSQGQSLTLGLNLGVMNPFKNDHDKRDFVSCGAAAGVAAAFGAPIGGVLFSLEEGSSFWNQMLTWRSFFTAMISTFTLNLFLSGTTGAKPDWGNLSQPGLLSFGSFGGQQQPGYQIWELPFFVVIGAGGGLFGALFNILNQRLTVWRARKITTNLKKFAEAVFVGFLTAMVMFVIPTYVRQCQPVTESLGIEPKQFGCPDGTFNDMATVFFTRQEDTIKQLFHSGGAFSTGTLVVVFISLFLLACLTYGVSVPSGLFVPSIMVGCAYGRLIGHVLKLWFPHIDPGTYALIGAAGILGGVVRMTISLTVIIIESTNDIKYGLPIMITIMVAKWVGDFFNHGLYDIHVGLKHIPFIEWEAPAVMNTLIATDIMESDVSCLEQIPSIEDVVGVLSRTRHNGFPIVDIDDEGNKSFVGMISRHQLVVLLLNKTYAPTTELAKRTPRISVRLFSEDYPRYKDVDSVQLMEHEMQYFMDLRPYMAIAPHSINSDSPLTRVFRLFRALGLRHLVVVDPRNNVEGMITRKSLTHSSCLNALLSLQTLDSARSLLVGDTGPFPDSDEGEGDRRVDVVVTDSDSRSVSYSVDGMGIESD